MKGVIKKFFAGKERTFNFNMLALEYACEALDLPLSDMFVQMQGVKGLKIMRVILHSTLQADADVKGETLDINALEVGVAMGEDPAMLPELMQCLTDSMGTGKKLEGTAESKKKSGLKT